MLLVLIFALSNMGLAEVAEQVADVPVADSPVEEVAIEEAAPEAEQQEETIVEEPVGEEEPDAPAADDTAEAQPDAPVEAAVPESVTVKVMATDETTLCAYEEIAPEGAYEVSYQWERAESADGEWTALDETSDVLVSDAEDRAEYVYRCTVSVGDVTATSEPATYNWGAPAEEEAAPIADLEGEVATFDEAITSSITNNNPTVYPVYDVKNTDTSIGLTVATVGSATGTLSYTWSADPANVVNITSDSSSTTATVKIDTEHFSETAAGLEFDEKGELAVKISCTVESTSPESDNITQPEPVTITVLKSLDDTEIQSKISFVEGKQTVETAAQKLSRDNTAVTAKFGMSEKYSLTWKVNDTSEFGTVSNDWATISNEGRTEGQLTIPQQSSTLKYIKKAGQEVYVQASIKINDTNNMTGVKALTIKPTPANISLKVNDKAYSAGDDNVYPAGSQITLHADVSADSQIYDSAKLPDGVDCYGGVTWEVKKGVEPGSPVVDANNATADFEFTPNDETATNYSVAATTEEESVKIDSAETELTVLPLSTQVVADNPSVTILDSATADKDKTLTLKFGKTGNEEPTATYQVVSWEIDKASNEWGSSNKTFIKLKNPKDGTLDKITYNGTALEIALNEAGLGTEDHGGPVIVTAKAKIKDKADPVPVKFEINVVPTENTALTAADIKIEGDAILGQPAEKGETDPDWSKLTAYIDNPVFAPYQVTWDIADDPDGTDHDSETYAEVVNNPANTDTHKAEIRAFAVKENASDTTPAAITGAAGQKITIKATVATGANEGAGTTAYKEITIYPQATQIHIGKVPSTSNTTVSEWYDASDDVVLSTQRNGMYVLVSVNGKNDAATKYYNKVDATSITIQKKPDEDSQTEDPIPLTITDKGVVTLGSTYTSTPGSWILHAETDTGDERNLTLTFRNTPYKTRVFSVPLTKGDVDEMTEKAEKEYGTTEDAYVDSETEGGTTLDLYAYPLDVNNNSAYVSDMVWALDENSSNSLARETDFVEEPLTEETASTANNRIYLKTTDKPDHVELHVPQNFTFSNTKNTFRVIVRPSGKSSSAGQMTITFTLKDKPTASLFSGVEVKFTPDDTSNTQYIAQGEEIKLELVDKANDEKDGLADLANYKLAYEIDKDASVPEGTDVADWISITRTSNTSATIKAAPAGEKNKLTKDSHSHAFAINIFFEGAENEKTTAQVTVVSVPDHMDISMGTRTDKPESSTPKEYEFKPDADTKIPLALPVGCEIYLKPEMAMATDFTATTKIGRTPTMSVDNTQLATIAPAITKEAATGTQATTSDEYWTLKADSSTRTGTVKVTASWTDASKSIKVEKTIEIDIINESGITPADPAVSATSCADNSGRAHVWALKAGDEQDSGYKYTAGADGHVYTCIYCGEDSKPVPHAHYEIETKDGQKEEDVLWVDSGTSSKAGYILCDVCGYVCPHTGFNESKTATRSTEGDYHTATCAICGKTLKQEHNDGNEDGICEGCGASNSEVTITNATENFAIVDGKTYKPNFQVSNTQRWEATFEVAAGDDAYISVDKDTGEVTANAVKTTGPAKVNAEFTVYTTSGTGETAKTTTSSFDFSYEVETRNSTGDIQVTVDAANMSGDKAWVIAGNAIKLTATTANSNPYLKNFKWGITDANASDVYFVKENKDGTADTKTKITDTDKDENGESLLHKQSIWLYVDDGIGTSLTGDNAITVTYAGVDKTAKKGEIKVEALAELKTADLTKALTFGDVYPGANAGQTTDKTKIIEGQSIGVSLKSWADKDTSTAFDERYGAVTFTVAPASDSGVREADTSKWIEIKNNNTIETHKGMFKANETTKDFEISATIVTGKGADGTDIKVVGKRTVTIVPAPTKITVTYGADAANATTALPTETNLSYYEGATFALKAVTGNTDADAKPENLTWTVEPADAVKDVTDKDAPDKSTRTYEIKKGAGDFTVTISGYDLSTVVPVDVKKLITDFTFEVKNPKVAIGETDVSADNETSRKQIEVTVSKVPADADDDFNLKAYTVTANDDGTVSKNTPEIASMFQEGEAEGVYTYTVPWAGGEDKLNNSEERRIMLVAEAGTSKEANPDKDGFGADTEIKVARNTIVELYKEPNSAEAFELETSKASVPVGSVDTLTLTKGASVTITKHGYNAKLGYGDSTGAPLDVHITDPGKDSEGTATAEPIITVEPDADGNLILTAVGEGNAEIAVYSPITYSETDKGPKKTLAIVIEPEIDSKIVTVDNTIAAPYDIKLNQELPIPKSAFKATRTTEAGTQDVTDGSVQFELKAEDSSTVSIFDGDVDTEHQSAGNWVVVGKAVGSTKLYAAVGTAESDHFEVNVKNAPTGINFTVDGETYENGDQIQKVFGTDNDPIVITANIIPATAEGTISLKLEGTSVTGEPSGSSVTVTPAALGTTRITAEILTGSASVTETPTNPQYLRSYIEILMAETPGEEQIEPPTPSDNSVKFIDEAAIGPNETTRVYVTGVAEGETVAWTTEPASGVISVEPDANDQTVATVKYEAIGEGKATVIATITGTAGERTAEEDVYLLTPVEGITLMHGASELQTLTMGKSEAIEVHVEKTGGREFMTPELAAEAEGKYIAISDPATSITSSNEKLVTVTGSEFFTVTAKAQPGKKDAVPQLTVSMAGVEKSLTMPVTITTANKSFNIGAFNGSTLYMKPGESKQIEVKTNPTKSFVNLICSATAKGDEEGDYEGDLIFTQADKMLTVKVDESVGAGMIYNVSVTADGYANHADQGFTVVVVDEAEQGDEPQLAVRKVGVEGTGYAEDENGKTTAVGSVTVAKNEQLQAYFIDKDGNTVSGNVSWNTLTKAQQKKVTISATGLIKAKANGSVTISGSINGMTSSITINVKTAPKYALAPNETTRKVAVGEEFKLGLTSTNGYPDANANIWYTIDATNNLDLTIAKDENGDDKDGVYTFEKPGTTTLSLKPVWGGKAKTVKFTVVEPLASDFDVPATATVAPKGSTIIRASLVEGYANLTWRVGETADSPEITTAKKKVAGMGSVQVQKLANDAIQITTNKATVGSTIKLLVQSAENTEGKAIEVTVKAADAGFPAGTEVVFDKPVITVGESTTVSVKYADDVETLPTGTIKYGTKKGGDGSATVKGNKVTGKKAGLVTVTAKLGSGAAIEKQIFVLPKASIVTSLKPTTMHSGESVTMDVTLKNYELNNTVKPVPTTPEYLQEGFSTEGVLTAESNSSLINVALSQDPETETPNVYQLTLTATDAVKNTKGKYTSATITLKLSNNAKKTFKIQVVEGEVAGWNEMQMPKSITVAKGMSVSLTPAVSAGKIAPNLNWQFASEEDAAAAKAHFLTISDGKVTTDSKNTTPTTEAITIDAIGAEEDVLFSVDVNIVASKVKKNGFKIVVPSRTLHAGENILATVQYDAGSGAGDVTWKSNHTDVIAVDKKSGMLTIKGKTAKYDNATITATANGKKATLKVFPGEAVKTVAFTKDVLAIDPTKTQTINLADYVKVDGAELGSAETYQGLVSFFVDDSEIINAFDEATGELTLVTAPEDETLSGTIHATVISYNNKSASMAIEVGEGDDSGEVTPPTPPEVELDPATVELSANGISLDDYATEGTALEMNEGDKLDIIAVVKDETGKKFTPKTTMTWAPLDDEHVSIESTGLTATLTATKATNAGATLHTPVKVSLVVTKKDGTALPEKAFYVKINYKLREENVSFTFEPSALLVGTTNKTSTATFAITVPELVQEWNGYLDVKVENLTEDIITLTDGGVDWTWTISPKAVGEGQLKITVSDKSTNPTTPVELFSFTKTITVNGLPNADEIKIMSGSQDITDGTLKLGTYEPGEFEIVMPESFLGTPASGDVDVTLHEAEPDTNGDYPALDSSDAAVAAQPKLDENGEPSATDKEILKWNVVGKDIKNAKKFRVQVELYPTETETLKETDPDVKPIIKAFTVELAESPADFVDDIKVTATPAFDETVKTNVNTGVNQEVTLEAVLGEGMTWTKGLEWKWDNETTYDDYEEDQKPVATIDGGVLKFTSPIAQTFTFTLGLKGDDTTLSSRPVVTQSYTITVAELPAANEAEIKLVTEGSVKGQGTVAEPYILGEKEKVDLKIDFTSGAYTNDVTWSNLSPKISLSTTSGLTTTVTGASITNGNASLEAYAGNVKLGDTKYFIVVDAPTKDDVQLKDSDANGTIGTSFTSTFKGDTEEKYVTVDVGETKSATFELESNNDRITFEAQTGAGKKNVWQVKYGPGSDPFTSPQSVTVTVVNKDLGIRKSYNMTVTANSVSVQPSAEAKEMGVTEEIEATTPGADIENPDLASASTLPIPDGFESAMNSASSDGNSDLSASNYVKNQQAVTKSTTVSPDGKTMTITISANVDGMNAWKSSDTTNGGTDPKHWYLLVLDTGVAEGTWYCDDPSYSNGTYEIAVTTDGFSSPTDDNKLTKDDIEDAAAFDPSVKVGCPLWLNLDLFKSPDYTKTVKFYIRERGTTSWPADPYMTFNIVPGDITSST